MIICAIVQAKNVLFNLILVKKTDFCVSALFGISLKYILLKGRARHCDLSDFLIS